MNCRTTFVVFMKITKITISSLNTFSRTVSAKPTPDVLCICPGGLQRLHYGNTFLETRRKFNSLFSGCAISKYVNILMIGILEFCLTDLK